MPPQQRLNGTELFYELTGSGDPLVLVHGSWTDHKSWQFVVPGLARSFRVLTYDRPWRLVARASSEV
jgi:pimeloyl-ACP methyl ester carboxylesterase